MIDWLLQHSYVLGFNMKISTAAADRSLSLVSRCSPPFVVYAILPFTPLSLIHRSPQHHLPKPRQWPVSSPPATTLSLAMLINLNFTMRWGAVLYFFEFSRPILVFWKRGENKKCMLDPTATAATRNAVIPKEQRRLVVWPKSDTFIWSIVTCQRCPICAIVASVQRWISRNKRRFWIS